MLLRSCATASGCGTVVVNAVKIGGGDQLKIISGNHALFIVFQAIVKRMHDNSLRVL
jgi:hypothetical protein